MSSADLQWAALFAWMSWAGCVWLSVRAHRRLADRRQISALRDLPRHIKFGLLPLSVFVALIALTMGTFVYPGRDFELVAGLHALIFVFLGVILLLAQALIIWLTERWARSQP